MATKTVDLRQLRRELIIREWTRIFKNFRYLGFVGFTKGVPWRRLFLRQRVTEGLSEVDARFCKPWEGREVTENLGWKDMKPLFLGFPSAVCFSNDSQQFMEAMKRSCSLIPGGLLLGAKVDELLLSGPSFQKILNGPSQKELQLQLLNSLKGDVSLVTVLGRPQQELVNIFSNRLRSLTCVLDNYEKKLS
ncbi:hypothetical protein Gasu2_43220 [Galdieria sulphuraria]|uniref:Uncharacterized protein n=1 Tax=Galdieria sulphuraria TaxID=130081 RepID=M2VWS7_GALSU|nr:uncharacterized protein Gasu_46910 [Galdieria sulphuraria]EME27701.1 hypothetical protein Gasu_46910 [Galdieria sulphuraria]GJD10108.1 hypothetical protein Gasu2_43220 [Galdieria sulphuraria]|eukprot:XP_005704221.1 hypothetical protein Gasu_46910 [Galdieria sulphuraria]